LRIETVAIIFNIQDNGGVRELQLDVYIFRPGVPGDVSDGLLGDAENRGFHF
jgi:hypothetical protein